MISYVYGGNSSVISFHAYMLKYYLREIVHEKTVLHALKQG